jgi:hypothetical protein
MNNEPKEKPPTPYSPFPQVGMTLLQMLSTIGIAGLLGAWLFPLLLEWLKK